MKKIKIFLASSITELETDRDKLQAFVDQLNDIYFDYGIRISLFRCENGNKAITAEGKQTELDNEIRSSELCLFLFFRKLGDYTRHEFDVALEAFRDCKKPQIVTYFKYVDDPDEMQGEIRSFMQRLDEEIKHYYNIYKHIDTLRLGLYMQISLMGLGTEEAKVENGKILLAGREIADTENLPMFTGNQSITELKARLRSVTAQYYDLRARSRDDEANDELYFAYSNIASEKADLEKQLRDAEKRVLEISGRMYEETARGRLSPRQAAAYRAFERGDYRDALEILDLKEIMADLAHNEEMAAGNTAQVQTNVNELLQRIEVMSADGVDGNEAQEIEKIYETVLERIEKFNLEKDPIYSYAVFLHSQNDFDKAIAVAEQLDYYYSNPKEPASDQRRACLWNLLGALYNNTQRNAEAEETSKKSIGLYERMLREQPSASVELNLAFSYMNLGNLYRKTLRYEDAETISRRALEILERLAGQMYSSVEPNLADICNNLGVLYSEMQRYREAETMHQRALELRKHLARQGTPSSEYSLSMSYANIGVLYFNTKQYERAETPYRKAIEICERLSKQNPAAFEPALSDYYNNLISLYSELGRFSEAEAAARKAIGIRTRLAKFNPAAFEPNLALCYCNLGSLYDSMERYGDAELAYQKSIEIRERLSRQNPDVYFSHLADSYGNLGALYYNIGRFEEAEAEYRRAIEIDEQLVKRGPSAVEHKLAKLYDDLANLYDDTQRYQDAAAEYQRAIALRERLAKQNPALYEPQLAANYNSLGLIYENLDRCKEADAMYGKAIGLYEKLAKQDPAAFEYGLADVMVNLGNLYVDMDRDEETLRLFRTALAITKKHPNEEDFAELGAAIEEALSEYEDDE